jgi:hypothetical protein
LTRSLVESGDARTLLALDVDGVLLDPQRGGRGTWQVAFGERFGVDAGRLEGTIFAAPWADVVTGQRSVEAALAEALLELGWTTLGSAGSRRTSSWHRRSLPPR